MSTEIYYFSGTGNSLHVAKELQKGIPHTELIPMVSLLNKDVIETNGETVGFVFPIHMMTFPFPVKRFLKKLDLQSAKYIFAVSTRGGSPIISDIHIAKILKKIGKKLDCYFNLKMSFNSPTGVMPVYIPGMNSYPGTAADITALEADIQHRLDSIKNIIVNKVRNPKHDFPLHFNLFLKKFISALMALLENSKEKSKINYYADSTCNGCGICEKVCLSKKIKIIAGKPVWQKHVQCYFCYACFAYCPLQSILIKKLYTEKHGRYVNSDVTAHEIAGQKYA